MSLPKRTCLLPVAMLYEHDSYVHTVLADGSENFCSPPCWSEAYLRAAHEMGYSDPMRYTVEHEIAHHLVGSTPAKFHARERWYARSVFLPELRTYASRIIYRACHNLPMDMDEPESAAEEHLVNRLQRFANLGEPDAYGVLESTFGDQLPELATLFLQTARPWLRFEAMV